MTDGLFGVKGPVFYFPVPLADGRAMVGFSVAGKLTIKSTFIGTEEEVSAVCKVYTDREQERYAQESFEAMMRGTPR